MELYLPPVLCTVLKTLAMATRSSNCTLADLLRTGEQHVVRRMQFDEKKRGDDGGKVQNLDFVQTSAASNRYFVSGSMSRSLTASPIFKYHDFLPMPQAVRNLISQHQLSSRDDPKTGLLAEIDHAYLILGSRLYLWEIASGDKASTVEFSGLDAPITAMGLVPPRPPPDGNFASSVEWLLVLATKDEIQLVTVDRHNGALRIRPTEYAIPTDNVDVGCIAGSSCGRIFVSSSTTSSLSEIRYSAQEGWTQFLGLRRNIQRVECGRSPISRVVPGFVHKLLALEVPLASVVVDDSRHTLYSLNSKGFVEVFDLGPSGVEHFYFVDRQNVLDLAEALCTRSSSSEDLKFFRGAGDGGGGREGHVIASIHVIPPTESAETTLLAISNFGFRFYLSTWPSQRSYGLSSALSSGSTGRPKGLYLRHLRRPPGKALCGHLMPSRRDEELQRIGFGAQGAVGSAQESDGSTDVSEAGAFTTPVSFSDFESCRRATAGVSRYAIPPGAPVTKTLYSNRSLLVVSSASAVPTSRTSVSGAAAGGDTCRVMGFCDDQVISTERGGARANFAEEVTLLRGFPLSPPYGELLENITDMVDQPVTNIGLFKLALVSAVPKNLVQEGRMSDQECSVFSRLSKRSVLAALSDRLSRVKPLNPAATSHLLPRRMVLALHKDRTNSVNGIFRIEQLRPVDLLLNLIIQYRHANSPEIIEAFTRLGKSEACALCFSIGCGLPRDLKEDSTSLDRNTTTLIANILKHKIVSQSPQSQLPTGGLSSSASSGGGRSIGDVRHSPSFEGAMLFLSRLLRPLWFSPVVTMPLYNNTTPEPVLNPINNADRHNGNNNTAYGARAAEGVHDANKRPKVNTENSFLFQTPTRGAAPLVVSPLELDGLRRALERFSELVEEVYKDDLDGAAASMKGEGQSQAPIPEYLNSLVTGQLAKTHEKIGLAEERKVVLSLYALAQTSMQALTLVLLLANNSTHCNVRWHFLNGLTLGQLVADSRIQKEISHRVSDLDSSASLVAFTGNSVFKDKLLQDLEQYCGIFFPEAVRYQAMAAKEISRAKQFQQARNMSDGHQSAEQAMLAYKEAAKRWRSGDDVIGVATPLDLATKHLRSLSRADGVVDVCLIASKNFEDDVSGDTRVVSSPLLLGNAITTKSEGDRWLCGVLRDAPMDLSSRRAVRSQCFSTAVAEIANLLDMDQLYPPGANGLALQLTPPERMELAKRCMETAIRWMASGPAAAEFHEMLLDMLYDCGHRKLLVHLRSPFIDSFLRRRGDEALVWEHLHCIGELDTAASYALVLAESPDMVKGQRRTLETEGGVIGRLNCLDLALRSAREGVGRGVVTDDRLEAILHTRKMGEVQRRMLARLINRSANERGCPRDRWVPSASDIDRLKSELVSDANDLYNNLGFAYNAWEECLHVLKHVGLNDENEVKTLWRQIMLQCLPREVSNCSPSIANSVQQYIEFMTTGQVIEVYPDIHLVDLATDQFESGSWLQVLRSSVVGIGQGLFDPSVDNFTFPVRSFLLQELEQATSLVYYARDWAEVPNLSGGSGWVIGAMRDVGVPFDALYEAYAHLMRGTTAGPWVKLQFLSSFTILVSLWINHVKAQGKSTELEIFRAHVRSSHHRLSALFDYVRSEVLSLNTSGGGALMVEQMKRRMVGVEQDEFIRRMITH